MKYSTKWSGMALVVALVITAQGFSQDKDKEKKDGAPDFAAYLKASEPGPNHKLLDPLAGSWTYKAKMYMEPGKPPMETAGTAERKWIMNGRFLEEHYKGTDKEFPFSGLGLTGYDNTQKKYVNAWVDNMSSGIMTSTGTADASGKVFTFKGECMCPVEKKMIKSRDVTTIDGPDKHHMEMYRLMDDGKEMKVMEIHYTRVKK